MAFPDDLTRLLGAFTRLLGLDFSRVDFISPLSLDECENRLRDLTVWQSSPQGAAADTPIIGEVSRESFFLYARPHSRNPFQTCLSGKLMTKGTGTRLECQLTIFAMTKAFLIFWFTVGTWIEIRTFHTAANSLLFGSGRWSNGGSAWWEIIIPPTAFLFGIAACRLGRAGAKVERALLIRFLWSTLAAREIFEGAPAS